jgi:sortase A
MRRAAKWIERCLWTVGFLALGTFAGVQIYSRVQQAEGNRELDRRSHEERAPAAEEPVPAVKVPPVHGSAVGRIEIPRLELSAVVFEGTDTEVLQGGVGHLTGSSLPGEKGNVVFAGHRDTFFRALKNIRKDDVITVTTGTETRRYSVGSTEIINPNETGVLDATRDSTLTLVTCYPFYYVGHAPKRFIVRCHEVTEQPVIAQVPDTPAPSQPRPAVRKRKPAPKIVSEPVASPIALSAGGPTASEANVVEDTPEPQQEENFDSPPQPTRRSAGGIKKLNPMRLFGKLAHAVRRSDKSEP